MAHHARHARGYCTYGVRAVLPNPTPTPSPNPNPNQADVAAYLLNYMAHSGAYSQERRNCQTFAADLFALLSGRR